MKTCIKCGIEKELVDFGYNGMTIDQKQAVCKECQGVLKTIVEEIVEEAHKVITEVEEIFEPVVEAPVVEAPVVEAPVVEAPVVEAPVVE